MASTRTPKTAVIIPTISGRVFIEDAIASIKAQTLVPDIVIVAPAGTEIKSKGVIKLNLNENLGSAGNYFLGGRWAYDNGYELIIFADDDAILEEKDTLARLAASYAQGNALTYISVGSGGPMLPSMYGTISRDALAKSGFYFKDFFYVREDLELDWRLRKNGYVPAIVNLARFTHPCPRVGKKTYTPALLYFLARNSIAFKLGYGKLVSVLSMGLMYSSIMFASLFGGRLQYALSLASMFVDVLSARLGARPLASKETLESETELKLADVVGKKHVIVGYAQTFAKTGIAGLNILPSDKVLSISSGPGSILRLIRSCLGMQYVVYESSEMRYSFLSYFGKNVMSYRAFDGKLMQIRRNGIFSPLQAALVLACSILLTVLMAIPLALLSFVYAKRFAAWAKESVVCDISSFISGVEMQ